MEDDILWKTTFKERRPFVEDGLQWKMTFGGRLPSVEDDEGVGVFIYFLIYLFIYVFF